MGAVKSYLKFDASKVEGLQIADLNKKNIALLRAYAKTGKTPFNFCEVMACEGGCITGPSAFNSIAAAKRQLAGALAKQDKTYAQQD